MSLYIIWFSSAKIANTSCIYHKYGIKFPIVCHSLLGFIPLSLQHPSINRGGLETGFYPLINTTDNGHKEFTF